MSDGYYDPHPSVRLRRPLVLLGHPGSDVARIAHELCARTGLPLNDVARSVEARAGRSTLRILHEEGEGVLAELEEGRLHAALERRPHGVVALSTGAAARTGASHWLTGAARVIAVRRPPEELLRRLRRSWAAAPGTSELREGPPADAGALADLLLPWEHALESAHARLEAGEEHSSRVAERVRRHEDAICIDKI